MKTRLLITACVLLSISSYAQTNDAKIKEVENNLEQGVQITGTPHHKIMDRMAFYHVKGLSVAVIKDHKLLWAKAYGFADDSLKIPATVDTRFQAASVSKSLNAVGVLKLVQQKKLDLYADINTNLKSWKFPYDSLSKGKKINTANLLSHTAGLTVHGFGGYVPGDSLPSIPQILDGQKPANSKPVRSMYEPGKKYEYSGGGVTISQLELMDITQKPYADYMSKEVLLPLGMSNSSYQQPSAVKAALLAHGYNYDAKEIKGSYHIYPEQAAAGLWTKPTDLAKYIIEMQNAYEGRSSKVLKQETVKLMFTPYQNKNYALGVFIDSLKGTAYFQHSGANEGFRSQYYGSLQGGNGVVVMVNSDNGNIIPEIVNSVSKAYGFNGLYTAVVKPSIDVPVTTMQKYLGEYQIGPKFTLTITQEGNNLYARGTGQEAFKLYAKSETVFFPLEFNAEIEFQKDDAGAIKQLTVSMPGAPNQIAKKIK